MTKNLTWDQVHRIVQEAGWRVEHKYSALITLRNNSWRLRTLRDIVQYLDFYTLDKMCRETTIFGPVDEYISFYADLSKEIDEQSDYSQRELRPASLRVREILGRGGTWTGEYPVEEWFRKQNTRREAKVSLTRQWLTSKIEDDDGSDNASQAT